MTTDKGLLPDVDVWLLIRVCYRKTIGCSTFLCFFVFVFVVFTNLEVTFLLFVPLSMCHCWLNLDLRRHLLTGSIIVEFGWYVILRLALVDFHLGCYLTFVVVVAILIFGIWLKHRNNIISCFDVWLLMRLY